MRTLLFGLAALCAAAGAADFVVSKHGHYAWEEWPFAQGVFGFAASVAVVLVARAAGRVLRRREDYYRDG